MDTAQFPPPRRRNNGGRGKILLALLIAACIVSVLSIGVWSLFGPNRNQITPSYGAEKPIFYKGKLLNGQAKGIGDSLLIPLSVIKDLVDPEIAYEQETKSVIITTGKNVVRLQPEQLKAWVNEKPFELRFPVEEEEGETYVPVEPLARFYGVRFAESEETGIVTLLKPGDIVTWVAAPAADKEGSEISVPVREAPTIRAPMVGRLKQGERASVWSEEDGWYYVQLSNGYVGYVEEKSILLAGSETIASANPEEENSFVPKKPMGQRIVLAWEQVHTKTPDPGKFGQMHGLNVVSPTWFHLLDGEGALENRADASYVRWAHDRGYQVWALFSNRFDPKLTAQALSSYDRRMTIARQLVSWAEMYKLDGINIDFENVNLEDGPGLTQFVRELTPLLHEAGLTVSIDVTFVSSSPNWSMFYDRKALAGIVDYMMLMAYDEHWATSPVAGSVASLPWVERGLKQLIDEYGIPPSKLILGVPFYSRVWTEETADGKTKVSSKAVGMEAVRSIIEKNGLSPKFDADTGQNYVEYEENGAVKKIWLEDETSMESRANLVLKYGLAGLAAWSRGFEKESIWVTIDKVLQSSP
ncbi:glycosyl hydrolase family 18 protein [Paenibacillus alkalitolerans]|uniref:glycosyl hydrolase family 18 protein n=1 Tax=Paenibacillus alkalitolerans TaxID=2799335 RepID=UPI0018F5C09E|nr:glycosyl hydrolase family 18 protein [Paenibacillus alkalitolerans]